MAAVSLIVPALAALAVSAAATWLAANVARRIGLVDRPGPRKIHGWPVPLGGGVGVGVGVALGLLAASAGFALLPSVAALVAVGLIDDARGLRPGTRLGAQAAAVLPAVVVYTPSVGAPRPLEVALALLWVLATISAVNCLDCADGVAAGVAVVAASALGSLGGWQGPLAPVAAVLAGASAGFLVFNTPPARCFLGEAGSTLLGFLLAILSFAPASALPSGRALPAFVAAATVLALPLLDFLLVHARRAHSGVRRLSDLMASAGTDHLPHRLRAAGLGPRGVAATCTAATAASAIAAGLGLEAGTLAGLGGLLAVCGGFLSAEIAHLRAVPKARAEPRRPAPGAALVDPSKAGTPWS